MQARLRISGMTCTACSSSIERSLKRKNYINAIEVDLVNAIAVVDFDRNLASIDDVIKHIDKLGFGAQILQRSESTLMKSLESSDSPAHSRDYVIAMFFALILFIVSMGSMFVSIHNESAMCAIEILLLIPILYAGRKIYKKGFLSLIKGVPNMDSLVFLGSFSAIVYSAYVLIEGAIFHTPHVLHEVYFESAGVIIAIIMLGKYIEQVATSQVKTEFNSLINLAPKTALIARGNVISEISIERIQADDIIVIPKGAMASVDGILLDIEAKIDESIITGESRHKKKSQGQNILSGSINLGEQIRVRALASARDSLMGKIINLMHGIKKAPIARIADIVSSYFVPSIIALSLLGAVVWFVIKGDLHFSFIVLSSTLLISCPCALGLATPLSILIANSIASKKGIYFKSGESLEGASKLNVIVFDKTGTLTKGTLQVASVHFTRAQESARQYILQLIYTLESHSEHAIASAIKKHIAQESANVFMLESHDVETTLGGGISAIIDNKHVRIGNLAFIQRAAQDSHVDSSFGMDSHAHAQDSHSCFGADSHANADLDSIDSHTTQARTDSTIHDMRATHTESAHINHTQNLCVESTHINHMNPHVEFTQAALESLHAQVTDSAHTLCYFSVDDEVCGVFELRDELQDNATSLIRNLKALDIHCIIASGDNENCVSSIARRCGINEFHHSMLPDDKLTLIKALQEKGTCVGFIGDGVNDALALKAANIPISLFGANDIALKIASIIIMNRDLNSLYCAILLSQKTLRNIKENLTFAFAYNVCAIPLALGIPQALGFSLALNPMIAGLAMGVSSLSVVLSAMRLRFFE